VESLRDGRQTRPGFELSNLFQKTLAVLFQTVPPSRLAETQGQRDDDKNQPFAIDRMKILDFLTAVNR
jgi:hypothetical protein